VFIPESDYDKTGEREGGRYLLRAIPEEGEKVRDAAEVRSGRVG